MSVLCVLTLNSKYTSLITLLWRGVDIQLSLPTWRTELTTKAVQAARLKFPIQLEVKAKELIREMEFSPLNLCVIQAIGNLGESNKATTHGENIFMPPTAFQC